MVNELSFLPDVGLCQQGYQASDATSLQCSHFFGHSLAGCSSCLSWMLTMPVHLCRVPCYGVPTLEHCDVS